MSYYESQGAVLQVRSVESPETWVNIGQVTGIQGLRGGAANIIDTTHLGSTRREKKMGLPDDGQVTVGLIFDPDDTGQAYCVTARANRTREEFRIDLNDAASPDTMITFGGYVLSMPINLAVDDVIRGDMTIETSGEAGDVVTVA